jgi:hypothetical protein
MKIDGVTIPTMPPVHATATRAESGELKSEVLRRANSASTPVELLDRFADYETAVERLDADLRLPEPYRVAERAKLREQLHVDAEAMETDEAARRFQALADEESAVRSELKQSFLPNDMGAVLMIIERTRDEQTLIDLAEEAIARDYGPRIRATLPDVITKLRELAGNNETAKARAARLAATFRRMV